MCHGFPGRSPLRSPAAPPLPRPPLFLIFLLLGPVEPLVLPLFWSSGLTSCQAATGFRCMNGEGSAGEDAGHRRPCPGWAQPMRLRDTADGSSGSPSAPAAPAARHPTRRPQAHLSIPASPHSPLAAPPRPIPPAADGEGDGQCQDHGSAEQRGGHRNAGAGA